MSKLNCWEYKNCSGEGCHCPAAERFDGVNSGKNAGRICWYAKTLTADSKTKGEQVGKCSQCGFYNQVEKEEGSNLTIFF